MSADARLIPDSLTRPKYTEDAISANLEGLFAVDVFVDPQGRVTDAQLPKKIGYDMDERVLLAIRNARFTPRRDKAGQALSGWTSIKVRLQLE